MIFRFRTKQEAESTLTSLRNGGSASNAILREIREYTRLKDKYPFRGEKQ